MGSIPKIVSTPLKWASKKILHSTLLRFPGGDPHSQVACVYCPEMCRFSCPTAVVSANDAVTPCNKMSLLYKEEEWPGKTAQGGPLWPIYDCTGCGRCTEYCVYEMPVADRLFEARKKWKWPEAEKAAAELTDSEDPVGDLADELGDESSAKRRLENWIHLKDSRTVAASESASETTAMTLEIVEPKSLVFLQKQGHSATLHLDPFIALKSLPLSSAKKLAGRSWLLHESVWFSRHLKRAQDVQNWIEAARQSGAQIKRPFAQGHDCIDCGGEGAYPKTFPSQAKQMAIEIWERDQHRAEGILCWSSRCADHFRKSLGPKVPIIALGDLVE